MENKIIAGIVGVAICIILAAGVLVPAVIDAADNAVPITKTNEGTGHTFKQMKVGDVLLVHSVYSGGTRTDTWTLNGQTVLNDGIGILTWDWGLISDAYFMQVNAPANSALASGQSITGTPGNVIYYGGASETYPDRTYSWTLTDSTTLTLEVLIGDTPGTGATYTVSWVYVVSTLEDGAFMSAQVTTNSYYALKDSKDLILAGNYTTGDLDTGYYYGKDGELTLLNSSYTGTINIAQTKSSGTTDIYDTLLTVTITDGNDTESFSPYRALVPYQVNGHSSDNAIYTLINVIPIFVIVAILLAAVAFFVVRRSY